MAFVSHRTAIDLTDGKSDKLWAKDLRSIDFRLICRNQSHDGSLRSAADDFNNIAIANPNPNSVHNIHRFRVDRYLSPITDFRSCHLARIPSPVVVTSSVTPEEVRFEVLQVVTQLSHTFTESVPLSFRLFGVYRNQSDLMFSDRTLGIRSLTPETTFAEALGPFLDFLEDNDPIYCANSGLTVSAMSLSITVFLSIMSSMSLKFGLFSLHSLYD